jgi:hypothetical protein
MYKTVPVHVSVDEYVNAENGDGQEVIAGRVVGVAPSVYYRNDIEGVQDTSPYDYPNEAVVAEPVSAYPVSPALQTPSSQFPCHYKTHDNVAGTVTNPPVSGATGAITTSPAGIQPWSNDSIVIGGLIATVFQWASFAGCITIAMVSASCTDPFAACSNAMMGLPPCLFFFIVSTIGVWTFAYNSSMYKFISNKNGVIKAKEYFLKIPAMDMKLFHQVHCFHIRTEHYTDSDGNSQSRQVTHTTHKAELEFRFLRSRDITHFPENIDENSLSILRFTKSYEFNSPELLNEFKEEKRLFERSHMNCDEQRTFSEEIRIHGLYDEILSYGTEEQIPSIIRNQSVCQFKLLTAFFGISWFWYFSFGKLPVHTVQVKRMVLY